MLAQHVWQTFSTRVSTVFWRGFVEFVVAFSLLVLNFVAGWVARSFGAASLLVFRPWAGLFQNALAGCGPGLGLIVVPVALASAVGPRGAHGWFEWFWQSVLAQHIRKTRSTRVATVVSRGLGGVEFVFALAL